MECKTPFENMNLPQLGLLLLLLNHRSLVLNPYMRLRQSQSFHTDLLFGFNGLFKIIGNTAFLNQEFTNKNPKW